MNVKSSFLQSWQHESFLKINAKEIATFSLDTKQERNRRETFSHEKVRFRGTCDDSFSVFECELIVKKCRQRNM